MSDKIQRTIQNKNTSICLMAIEKSHPNYDAIMAEFNKFVDFFIAKGVKEVPTDADSRKVVLVSTYTGEITAEYNCGKHTYVSQVLLPFQAVATMVNVLGDFFSKEPEVQAVPQQWVPHKRVCPRCALGKEEPN